MRAMTATLAMICLSPWHAGPVSAQVEVVRYEVGQSYAAAVAHGADGRFDAAEQSLGTVLSRDPLHTPAKLRMRVLDDVSSGAASGDVARHLFRSVALANEKRYESALEELNAAIQLDSTYDESFRLRGRTYVDLEDFEAALADYTVAIDLNPTAPASYINRSRVFGVLGDTDRALADLSAAVEVAPESADALANRGGWLAQAARFEEAQRDLVAAIEVEPRFVPAYGNLGMMFELVGEPEQALRVYRMGVAEAGYGFPGLVTQLRARIAALGG